MTIKENYNFLGGEEEPMKQHVSWRSKGFSWQLSTLKKTSFLGGCNISLALRQIKSGRSFLGG
jgi:hypothetical protein